MTAVKIEMASDNDGIAAYGALFLIRLSSRPAVAFVCRLCIDLSILDIDKF